MQFSLSFQNFRKIDSRKTLLLFVSISSSIFFMACSVVNSDRSSQDPAVIGQPTTTSALGSAKNSNHEVQKSENPKILLSAGNPSDSDLSNQVSVTVDGKFKNTPSVVKAEDEAGGTVILLNAEISNAVFSPHLNDALALSKAQSRFFVSPEQKGCVITDDSFAALGQGSQALSLGARDASDRQNCAEFMSAIQTHGFTIQYNNVPLMSGSGTVKTVFVNFSSPRQP